MFNITIKYSVSMLWQKDTVPKWDISSENRVFILLIKIDVGIYIIIPNT